MRTPSRHMVGSLAPVRLLTNPINFFVEAGAIAAVLILLAIVVMLLAGTALLLFLAVC